MILPPKDLLDILVNLKECIDSGLLFDEAGDWRGAFLAQVFGASSYELSYENSRIDFKGSAISSKITPLPKKPPGNPMLEYYILYFYKRLVESRLNIFFNIGFQSPSKEYIKYSPLTQRNVASIFDVKQFSRKFYFNQKTMIGSFQNGSTMGNISLSIPDELSFDNEDCFDSLLIKTVH